MSHEFSPHLQMDDRPSYHVEVPARELLFSIARKGLASSLEDIALAQPVHPDVISTQPAFTRELVVIASHQALMQETRSSGKGCPFERHAAIGSDSIGQTIFGDKDEKMVGLSQEPLSDDHHLRKSEVVDAFAAISPEDAASETVHGLQIDLHGGQTIESAVSHVLLKTVLQEAVGDADHDTQALYRSSRKRLVAAFAGGLLKPGLQKQLGIGQKIYDKIRRPQTAFRDIAEGYEHLNATDIMHLYAATPAVIPPTYWLTDHILSTPFEDRPDLDAQAVAAESLRIAPSTILPARQSELGKDEASLTFVSPHLILRDPTIVGERPFAFDESRFQGTDGETMRKRVQAVAFGYGGHHCPAARFTISYLSSLAEQLKEDRTMLTTKGDTTKPNKWRTNTTVPQARHQAKLVTV